MTRRRYRSRGVEVEIGESKDQVALSLDGIAIDVALIDGRYHSQTANQFRSFSTIDELVDTLLKYEGRTWTLHGHVCDERCDKGRHHRDHGHGDHGHGDHGRDHGPGDPEAAGRR
jgi:hypothetical protein